MPLFADLDRLRADLDALRPLAPEQEARVLQKFRLEWNYNSNAIEGNSLTLGETRSLLLHGLTAAGKPMRDHLDIKGHNEAVLWLEDIVRDDRPLTEQFIRGMHEVLLGEPFFTPAQTADGQPIRKMITPGRYKSSPNNVLTATGEMFYFASPEETPSRMTDLVDWYRAEEAAPTLPPVALAAEFHYRFVRIHPFDDGNGRMSRLLMNLILLRHGYPMTVIKADDRNRYLAALSEADAGEPEPFLRFIIENVEASLRLMIRAARGEAIDELSDLDKKLALLKKQVLNREDFGRAIWSPATQIRIYEATLKFWLEDVGNELSRFNDFFNEAATYIQGLDVSRGSVSRGVSTTDYSLSNTLTYATDIFVKQKRLLAETTLYFEWNKFRNLLMPFDLGVHLKIEFGLHRYQIETAIYERQNSGYGFNSEKILDTLYTLEHDHAQIHEINYKLANKVYDFIAAKLTEADTPPA